MNNPAIGGTPPRASFFDLPAELRNRIYEYCLDITYDVYRSSGDQEPTYWSQLPKNLHLFLVCKQIYQEAGSLLYLNYFPDLEYEAKSILDLYDFCSKVPEEHRGTFKAHLRITRSSLDLFLDRIGLHRNLPWEPPRRSKKNAQDLVSKRLRGDCFQATRIHRPESPNMAYAGYDRVSIYGHLGRLQWVPGSFYPVKIQFRPPRNG
jgi:hypothetical protein